MLVPALVGCIDDDGNDELPAPPAATELSGTYGTQVRLVRSSCAGIAVEDQPTTVDQIGVRLTITHGPVTYRARLDKADNFSADPQQIDVGPDVHTLSLAGSFGEGELYAVVNAEVTGDQSCTYQVAWHGTRP